MTLRKWASLAGMVFVASLASVISGCSGGGSIGTTNAASGGGSSSGGGGAISISLSETRATVDEGATAQFAAIVTNDSANVGVTWTVSCSAASCGSVSPNSTASGATTTYTPPDSLASNLTVTLTAASVADATKSASLPITVPALTISVAPMSDTLQAGGTTQLTATVTNDGASKGVTWTVSCPEAPCGTVSPTITASGSATTYTAPTIPPANGFTVTLTATSVTDGIKVASAMVTIPPGIALSVTPSTATVQAGGTAQFTATVKNDSANKGVTWTVSCSAAPCGSVSPTSTASGVATTYTAPATAPSSSLTVTLIATSVTDATKTASAVVTIPAISVSVTPSTATIHLGATAQFVATVMNDSANKGVTWTVSCAAAPCGSVSPAVTPSGIATTYTAPATLPVGNLRVTLTAASVTDSAVAASAAITIPGIAVSIAPSSATVPTGGTQQFTATVDNDPNSAGVTWQVVAKLFCDNFFHGNGCDPFSGNPIIFLPCTGCGTFSSASTASGMPVTYTVPAHLTPPSMPGYFFCSICSGSVVIVATSVTTPAASARASITILPISVSVSPTSTSVVLSATQQFTATVTNDRTNSGATWTLTQNGVACAPDCGTISPASTASGAAATYAAPATAPSLPVLTVTATSVEYKTESASATITITSGAGAACGAGSGSESLLNGQYAFLLHGFDSNGDMATVGSFTADGTGKISAGEEDIHRSPGLETDLSINATTSSYAVGLDHRGCVILANSNGQTTYFRFALGSTNSSAIATSGHIIEFDDTTGTGTRVSGTIRLQDATAFTASHFKGNYTFGVAGGSGGTNGRFAMAGTLASDGVSTLTTSSFDVDSGTTTSNASSSPGGSFTCCSANGRGTLQISAISLTVDFWVYMINSGDAFLVSTDVAVASGEAIGVQSGTSFSQGSLSGASVLRQTAQSASGPIVDIAAANADGKGTLTVNDNVNNAGTFSTGGSVLNFVVASNGRVITTGVNTPPVIYLYARNRGFLVGTDPDATFGILEPQAAGPFSKASLSGAYILGSENPSASAVTLESGSLTADGSGNATGTADQSSSAGLAQNQSVNFTYSISADGTGNVGGNTTAILVSGTKLVFINNTSSNPTITVVEK